MTKKTVCYYIERLVNYYNDREALIFKKTYRTQKWSYLDLYNYAHRIAGVFEEHGLKKGDKIIIYSYNCPEWGAILLACAISGIIAVPLDFNSNKKFVKKISDTVKSKILFCSRYKPIKTNSKQILIEDLFEHIKKHHKYRCKANIKEDDILEIVYTSGTTSEPKGVIITNKNLVSNIRSLRLVFPLKKHLKFLSIVPLSHMFEQTVGFFIPLRFGCQIVYTTSRKSSSIKDAMYDEKVTSIVAVPVILKTLMNKIKRTVERKNKTKQFEFLLNISKKLPFFTRRILFKKVLNNLSPKLKFFVVGGAPLNNDVEHFWNSLGVLVLQGYGLTETSPILTCNSFKHHKEGTVGQVLPNQKIKISNDNEIICSGENVTSGYYKNKNATNKSLVNGWFYTGDFGKFDEQGYLSIKGRKKNMILTSSGLNVYPEDIEKIINRIDFVKDSIVLGIKETKDTIIIAVILLKKDNNVNNINKTNIIKQINSKLDSHQQIQSLVIWPQKDFPRTPSLKIKRRDVEEFLGTKKIKTKKINESNVLYSILANLSSKDISNINPSSILGSDLAIDSLHRVELATLIEEEYNIEIDECNILPTTSVKELQKLIQNQKPLSSKKKLNKLNFSKLIIIPRMFTQYIIFGILKLIYKLEIKGQKNLESINELVIFALNHSSHLDMPTLLRSLPLKIKQKMAFAAAQDYFFVNDNDKNKFKKKIFQNIIEFIFNIYPFSRKSNIRQSMKLTGKILDKGFCIGICPEGTRSINGQLQPFKQGIGVIATQMKVLIIPVKIEGLFEILPKGKIFTKPGKVTISFGKSIKFSSDESYLKATREIQKAVKSL